MIQTLQFENVVIVLACVFASVPVTFILFRVLESGAKYRAEGRSFMHALPAESLARPLFSVLAKGGFVSLGGAAAGFLLAFLLALGGLQLSYHPALVISEDWLLGHWEVLNYSEPEKLAQWQFLKDESDEGIVVRGDVWGIDDISVPTRLQNRVKLASFGPFPVSLLNAADLQFEYESEWGDGSAKFSQAFGFLGTYIDDPNKTSPEETDSGEILIHQDGSVNVDAYRLRSLIYAAGIVTLYAWLTALLAYYLFKFLKATAKAKTGRWILRGAVAFYYLFFSVLTIFGSLEPIQPVFQPADLEGEWQIEYLENRDRYGYLTARQVDDGWELSIALATQAANERRIRPRSMSNALSIAVYDPEKGQIEFDYESDVGTGRVNGRLASVMVGRFSDRDDSDEANWGRFVAVKRR